MHQLLRGVMRQTFADGGLGHRFGQEKHVCGPGPGNSRDGIEKILRQPDRRTDSSENGGRIVERSLVGLGSAAIGRHSLVDGGRRVGHGANDRYSRQLALERGGWDPGGKRDDHLVRRDRVADLGEQGRHVLGFDRDHNHPLSRRRFGGVE